MKKYFSFLLIDVLIVAVLFGFLPKSVNADMGPKPTVEIDLVYNQKKISDPSFSAKMLSCIPIPQEYFLNAETELQYEKDLITQLKIKEYDSSKQCYWIPDDLAWGGDCSKSYCDFGYWPPDEFKLAVYIPSVDKVFVTNEISRTKFDSYYKAELFLDGSAKISEANPIVSPNNRSSFAGAFLTTILLELFMTLLFIFVRKLPKKIIFYVLLANIFSLPVVWFLFPLIELSSLAILILSEVFAVLFEAFFVYILSKQTISFKQSLALSILNNFISLFYGNFLSAIFLGRSF